MEEKIISNCPVCDNELKISMLKCENCGLEIKKDFKQSVFEKLSNEQTAFLLEFVKYEGNIKQLQEVLGLSYPMIKKKVSVLQSSLNILPQDISQNDNWELKNNSKKASDIVKAFFAKRNGIAKIETATGKVFEVNANNETFGSYEALRDVRYEYKIFDIVLNLIMSKGGQVRKGNARNFRIGEKGCEVDTIAGVIGVEYYKKSVGEYTFDPVFLIVAIMANANIINNCRGYVELTKEYRELLGEKNG